MNRVFRIATLVVTGALLYVMISAFWPASYDVASLRQRSSTRFWHLSTGSRIGYTYIKATGSTKFPYPLIYLHGGPGAGITDKEIETFERLAEKGYEIYLYDQVGCGHSNRLEKIEDYSAQRHRHDLQEIIKKINSPKVVLVGQSWGSILATTFLASKPDVIHKLIITAPAPIQPTRKEFESIKAPDTLEIRQPTFSNKMANQKVATTRSKIIYYLARKYNFKLAADKEADQFATMMTTELNKSMVCDQKKAVVAEGTEGLYTHYMTAKSLARLPDQRSGLSQLHTPVLVMKAQCDNQPWGYTTEYLQVFKNSNFKFIKNAGHNIFLEQPALYVNTIDDFLRR